jgi:hypothetical protein
VITVVVGVMLAGFFGVMYRLNMVTIRHVSMMTGLFVVTSVVVLGGRTMMLSCFFVMLGSFVVMLYSFF